MRKNTVSGDNGKKDKKSAAEAAYTYLANRMRTVSEVEKHLEGKGYAAEEVTEAVNELIGMRYLDDYAFSMRYYEYNREKKRGVLRAERELIEKGVDRETAAFAKEDFLHEYDVDEFADALAIARRELQQGGTEGETDAVHQPDDRLAAKIARRLESKGFARGDIFKVLGELRRSED